MDPLLFTTLFISLNALKFGLPYLKALRMKQKKISSQLLNKYSDL